MPVLLPDREHDPRVHRRSLPSQPPPLSTQVTPTHFLVACEQTPSAHWLELVHAVPMGPGLPQVPFTQASWERQSDSDVHVAPAAPRGVQVTGPEPLLSTLHVRPSAQLEMPDAEGFDGSKQTSPCASFTRATQVPEVPVFVSQVALRTHGLSLLQLPPTGTRAAQVPHPAPGKGVLQSPPAHWVSAPHGAPSGSVPEFSMSSHASSSPQPARTFAEHWSRSAGVMPLPGALTVYVQS